MAGKPRGKCHYCNAKAATWDHIVAKSHLPKFGIPMVNHQRNKVPCCVPCNLFKQNMRSDCVCQLCTYAWEIMAEFILPKRKRDIPVVIMSERDDFAEQTTGDDDDDDGSFGRIGAQGMG